MNVEFFAALALVSAVGLACAAASQETQPAKDDKKPGQFILKNSRLKVEVMRPGHPEAAYIGTRFEWGATIVQATLGGKHTFLYAEKPGRRDGGYGPCEEMLGAIGFDGAGGKPFLKIGVGICQSTKGMYNPNLVYKILDNLAWKTTVDEKKRTATFVQVLKDFEGYAYRYEKRVVVDAKRPTVHIEHVLENTGSKAIKTQQYSHNFMLFDGHKVGPDYVATFTFVPEIKETDVVAAKGKTVIFKKSLQRNLYVPFGGFDAKQKNPFTVRHKPSGLAIRFEREFALSGITLWATPITISFEPMIRLDIKPGKKAEWRRSYTFLAKGEK